MATETSRRFSSPNLREGYETSREMFQEHPLPAALTVFGLGFGLGVAIGVLLAESESHARYDPSKFERYGRQFLDALAQAAPDALTKRFS